MQQSALTQGQKLDAVFAREINGENPSGGAVGYDQVTSIEVGQCAGPMGWYDVAVIKRKGTLRADEILPIHMAEYIRLLPYS